MQSGAIDCVKILIHPYSSEIAKQLYLAQSQRGSGNAQIIAALIFRIAFTQGNRMFSLFESLEEILLPILKIGTLFEHPFEFSMVNSYLKFDLADIFAQLQDSLQILASISETGENGETVYRSENLECSAKQNVSHVLQKNDKGMLLRRHIFRLFLGIIALFEGCLYFIQRNCVDDKGKVVLSK